MSNRLIALLTAGIVLLALAILWFVGRDERIIRKRLNELAEVVSMETYNPMKAVAATRKFSGFFTDPVLLETDYEDIDGTRTNEAFQSLFLQGMASAHSIHLDFSVPEFLHCKAGKARIRTDASLAVDFKRAENVHEQRHLHFNWVKDSGKWRIQQIQLPSTSHIHKVQ